MLESMPVCEACTQIFLLHDNSECKAKYFKPVKGLFSHGKPRQTSCPLCNLFQAGLLERIRDWKHAKHLFFCHTYSQNYNVVTQILQIRACHSRNGDGLYGQINYRTFTDEDGPSSSFLSGRLVSKDAPSDFAFTRMVNLVGRHDPTCPCGTMLSDDQTMPTLPKRVLDVAGSDDHGLIRLMVSEEGRRAHYVALSHCWGSTRFITTTDNFAARLEGIHVYDLPKTFQDAVAVTRKLGIRFLWIDSLCIIQRNAEDWDVESAKMYSYYGDSSITVAADCSADDSHGFLRKRQSDANRGLDSQETYYADEVQEFACTSHGQVRRLYLRQIEDEGFYIPEDEGDDPVGVEPLQFRAWTLQERLLPRRVLHFGSRQNYLEDHDGGFIKSEDGQSVRCSLFWLALHDESRALPFQGWYSVVEQFKTRGITVPSDTLPALSGLAQLVCDSSKDHYCAGLWRSDLSRGLLWAVGGPSSSSTSDGKQPPSTTEIAKVNASTSGYIAPSWSWASSPGRVYFLLNDLRSEVVWDTSPDGRARDDDNVDFSLVTVLDCETVANGTDAFGKLDGGYLKIRVPLLQAKKLEDEDLGLRGWIPVLTVEPRNSTSRLQAIFDSQILKYKAHQSQQKGDLFVAVVAYTEGPDLVSDEIELKHSYGLILERAILQPDTFRRVGVFKGGERGIHVSEDIKIDDRTFEGAEMRSITLI